MSHCIPSWTSHFSQSYGWPFSVLTKSHQTFSICPHDFWPSFFVVTWACRHSPGCASSSLRCEEVSASRQPSINRKVSWGQILQLPEFEADHSGKRLVHFLGRSAGTEPLSSARAVSVVHVSGSLSSFLYPPPSTPWQSCFPDKLFQALYPGEPKPRQLRNFQ